jgi:hypothetical protein
MVAMPDLCLLTAWVGGVWRNEGERLRSGTSYEDLCACVPRSSRQVGFDTLPDQLA